MAKKTKNLPILLITLLILAVICVSYIFYYNHSVLKKGVLPERNSVLYGYQVDDILLENSTLSISGWCFQKNERSTGGLFPPYVRIILADINDYEESLYYTAQSGVAVSEVNDYYLGKYDYTKCGFHAEIDLAALQIDEKDYEIVLQPNEWKEDTIHIGYFLRQGQIIPADPGYVPLDVKGTDLEEIVQNGKLRVYRDDLGIYAYQYQWKLYYIIDDHYPLADGWGNLGCNAGTNHSELLPEDMQEYGHETLGFSFESREITQNLDAGKYRVAVLELPAEYPILYIDTGYWNLTDSWVWQDTFCPGLPD